MGTNSYIVEGKGYDLSAMSVGVVKKSEIITGETIKTSDSIIGLESSGIHSNGLTLARKALLDLGGFSIDQVGNDLLNPTKIYSREILEIIQKVEIHGLAHITGGAFSKLNRLSFSKVGFELNDLPEPPQLFKDIQSITKISDYEMYRTFNMGIGFCIVTDESNYPEIERICKKFKTKTYKIGTISKEIATCIGLPFIDPDTSIAASAFLI